MSANDSPFAEPWPSVTTLTFADGPDVDRRIWTSPQYISPTDNPAFLGRTALRNVPDFGADIGSIPVSNNRAQLKLGTYNPRDPNNQSFLGSQISTIQKWGLESYDEVMFEAQVQSPYQMPGGGVTSLFSYNLRSSQPFQHDEIDFEFASQHWRSPGVQINTNVYVNNDIGNDQVIIPPVPVDFSQLNTFAIAWSRTRGICWFINGTAVRTDPDPNDVPQTDMSLTLNFWVPNAAWGWAYNADLQPANNPADNQEWMYEVLWAKVYVR